MPNLNKELAKIVGLSMVFPPCVIKAYSHMGIVFTSGDLHREAGIPRSTAKHYIHRMVKLGMISKIPHRRNYQKYANARTFSDWLSDLIRLAIRPFENQK